VGAGAATQFGTSSSDGFWVKPYFDPTNSNSVYQFYLHEQSSSYSSASCMVTSSSALKDIYCYFDAKELDLFFNGVSFVFNAPPGMCAYTALNLYSFYYLPAGYYNPPAISVAEDATGAVTGITFTAGGAVPANGATAVPTDPGTHAPLCPFDYSLAGGPNCCEGAYTVTINQAGTPGTSTTTRGKFGGKISNCIAGPGKDLHAAASGYPVTEITRTSLTGGNEVVPVAAPLYKTNADGSRFSGNVYLSNYFNPNSFGYVGTPSWPVSTTYWPSAIKGDVVGAASVLIKGQTYSFTDGSSYMTAPISMNPYYEYGCLDEAFEYQARIRLFVKSWDTLSGWTATSNPYTAGSEASFPEYPYHDLQVWEDLLNNFPGLNL
jgi:hypothetical protein